LSTPDIVGGTLIVGTADGLRAFDAKTGEPRWSVATDGPVTGAPADTGGTVVFATGAGMVVAVAGATGLESWRAGATASVYSSPAIGGRIVVVGPTAGP